MVEITQDEANALNIITQNAVNQEQQLKSILSARLSVITLLEGKYNATFNQETGVFIIKEDVE